MLRTDSYGLGCLVCDGQIGEGQLFCGECEPDTCFKCRSSSIKINHNEVKCSHGCTYSVHEWVSHKIYTAFLNGTTEEKIKYLGPNIELIFPENVDVTVHYNKPTPREEYVYGVHYTPNPEGFRNGVDRSKVEERINRGGNIRHNAVYAWPFKKEKMGTSLSPDYVYFEAPRNGVHVSSYRVLNYATGHQYGDSLTIPREKYDSNLVFTVDELVKTCEKHGKPVQTNVLNKSLLQ